MKQRKGISLIVLVITIIVMIIIAGAIIISLNKTNVIDQAAAAVEVTEEDQVKQSVLASMELTEEGRIDVNETYNATKNILQDQVVSVGELQEDGTFEVIGKQDSYTLKITGVGVEMKASQDEDVVVLDGWQGRYVAVQAMGTQDTFYVDIDGQGNCHQVTKLYDEGVVATDMVMDFTYEYDISDKNKFKCVISGMNIETPVYNLKEYNNKIFVFESGTSTSVFTTNGLRGLELTELQGKTFKCEKSDTVTELVFGDNNQYELIYYNSLGEQSSSNVGLYYTLPIFEERNQDKIMLGSFEYGVEKDENGNIVKIIDTYEDNTYIYVEQ